MHSIAPPQNSLYTPLRVHPIACFYWWIFRESYPYIVPPHTSTLFFWVYQYLFTVSGIIPIYVITLHWLHILFTVYKFAYISLSWFTCYCSYNKWGTLPASPHLSNGLFVLIEFRFTYTSFTIIGDLTTYHIG